MNRVGEVNAISQVDIAEKPATAPCCAARAWLCYSRVERLVQRRNGGLSMAQSHDFKITGKVSTRALD